MDHRVPRTGLIISVICALLGLLTFIYLNQAFEGPSPTDLILHPYHLEANFKDTEVLQTKFSVLVHGYDVGKVTDVSYDRSSGEATVTFTVDTDTVPIYRNATAFIGERTILGDSYVNLDPGSASAGAAPSGFEVKGMPSVNFDQALSFLDAKGRAHVRSILHSLAQANRGNQGGEELNATLAELSRTVAQLRDLTAALHGQEANLAGLVRDSSVVLHELGTREQSLRTIVAAGRATLDGLATNTTSLKQGLDELPGLLASGTSALRRARPLLTEARPLVSKLNAAAPDLEPVLDRLPKLSTDTVHIVSRLSGIPALRDTLKLVSAVGPLVPKLEAGARNLVTLLRFTAPRANGIAAFFANMASATAHGDSHGRWARFYINLEPGELADSPTAANCRPGAHPTAGVCHNAYTKPGDAAHEKPYVPGSYPHLKPYDPPR